jgi:hypothetical protein
MVSLSLKVELTFAQLVAVVQLVVAIIKLLA